MDSKLIIYDDYIYEAGSHAKKCASNLENVLTNYISTLQDIRDNSIMSGDIADTLSAYISCASKLKGKLKDIGVYTNSNCENFVSEVDEADNFLF